MVLGHGSQTASSAPVQTRGYPGTTPCTSGRGEAALKEALKEAIPWKPECQ